MKPGTDFFKEIPPNTQSTLAQVFSAPSEVDGLICKILAPNDDSGRHGIVIPVDAYPLFPAYDNFDASAQTNYTAETRIRWPQTAYSDFQSSRWKHYHRYPERRLTRLDQSINSVAENSLFVAGRLKGAQDHYEAIVIQPDDELYNALLLETGIRPNQPGCHIDLDWSPDSDSRPSKFIDEFMEIFDADVRDQWIKTSGAGSRGVGETFEAAFRVPRNSIPGPDWRDLEFKCSLEKTDAASRPKGLFLKEPTWIDGTSNLNDRVLRYGYPDAQERPSCFHAARIKTSKRGFALNPAYDRNHLELIHKEKVVAFWEVDNLEKSLTKKLKNTVFARAKSRGKGDQEEFKYTGVRYCANPSGKRFLECIANNAAWVEIRMGPKNRNDNTNKNFGCQFRVLDSAIGDIFSRIEVLKDPKLK